MITYACIFVAGYIFGHVAGGRLKQMKFKHLIRNKIAKNKQWQISLSLFESLLHDVDAL